MAPGVALRCVWLFLALAFSHVSADSFSVEVPKTPVLGLLNGSMSLPCTVSNNMDVRQLEVRWSRTSNVNTLVLLYKNEQIIEDSVDKQYQGRASLLGGLEKGDVSLKLDHLTVADEGSYICRVSSERWYDKKNITLRIQAVGTTPILSTADGEGGLVNVSCDSHGWFPKPSLKWRDRTGKDLNHLSKDKFTTDSEGLIKVSSWLLYTPSESGWVSCSVALSASNQDVRESRMMPCTPADSWKGAFIVSLLLLLLCVVGFGLYFVLERKGLISSRKKKEDTKRAEEGPEEAHPLNPSVEKQQQNEDPTTDPPHQSVFTDEHDHQIPESKVDGPPPTGAEEAHPPNPSVEQQQQKNKYPPGDIPDHSVSKGAEEAHPLNPSAEKQQQNADPTAALSVSTGVHNHQIPETKVDGPPPTVNIHIDPAETPHFLKITKKGKGVYLTHLEEDNDYDDVKIFTLCKETFSSGRHYWEVKLMERKQEKLSWYVGVASDTAERIYRVPFTPANGFWVLCYEEEHGVHIIDTNEMRAQLKPVTEKIQTLGVLLDCDQHTLSFYDAARKSLIYTFTNVKPRRSLYPLISPGIRDNLPITIC